MTDELETVARKFGSLSEYCIQLNRWILKSIGAWPASASTTKIEKAFSKVLIVLCWFFTLFTLIPTVLYIILEEEDVSIKIKTIGPAFHWFVGILNHAMLLLHRDDIRYCIEHLQDDWNIVTRPEDRQVMLKMAKLGRYIIGFCAGFMQGSVLCYSAAVGLFKQTVEIGNETMSIYLLPCPVYKVPLQTNPEHTIILMTQFLSGFIANSSAVAAFSLATNFASHTLGQLNLMSKWVNEYVNESRRQDKDARVHEIGVIVEHHLRILR